MRFLNIVSMPHPVLKMALSIDIILAQAVFNIHYGFARCIKMCLPIWKRG